MAYTKELSRKLYRDLLMLRLFEKRLIDLYAAGKIPGHIHSGIGEEAAFAGTLATKKEGDYFKMSHRDIGASSLLGVSLETMFAEILGKTAGNSGGRGGINHISELSRGMLGFSGTLGCDIAVAAGAGLTIQNRGGDNIVYVYFGDGTTSRGPVHEAINLAAAWKLPVLFVCENNQFAISTPVSEGVPVKNTAADRAPAYGIPGRVADGTDVFAVYEAAEELTREIRQGGGPAILECKAYRWRGHFEGDQARYRDQAEADRWIKKDCVQKMETWLLEKKMITETEIEEMRAEFEAKLDAAVIFAENSPEPAPETIYDYLYA